MLNYIGVRCPACNKKFTQTDDIVVCPVCGAPHHRSCYAEKNACVFLADHLSGKEWRNPSLPLSSPIESPNTGAANKCPRCDHVIDPGSQFCQACGMPLGKNMPPNPNDPALGQGHSHQWVFPGGTQMQVDSISMIYGGLNPEDEIAGETVKDIARYVGKNSGYYLPRFRMICENGRSFMPNLSAFIFSFFYYFYRKMYLVGVVLLALYMVSMIPFYLAAEEMVPQVMHTLGMGPSVQINQAAIDHYISLGNITRSINLFIVLLFSFFANRTYCNKVISSVNEIRTKAQRIDPPLAYHANLEKAGGCNNLVFIIVGVIAFLYIFSIIVSSSLLFLP